MGSSAPSQRERPEDIGKEKLEHSLRIYFAKKKKKFIRETRNWK